MTELKLKPEVLMHPNIPKPLHGLNPRTIKGQEWWDVERKKAYASTGYRCIACGIEKTMAKKFKWLEAHEDFIIDYKKGTCTIKEIIPLCHYCHSFIHSGRLRMIMGCDKSEDEVIEILEHGINILRESNLKGFWATLDFAFSLGVNTVGVSPYKSTGYEAEWGSWRLILEGKEYEGLFKDFREWQNHWRKK